MKKRWSIIVSCLLISICVLGFSACNGGESETHTHLPCEICGLCTDPNCTGTASEKCQGHNEPPVENPELNAMSKHFAGVKTISKKDTLIDENNVNKTFVELLDRQIDVLAQDVLFRLQVVYGTDNYEGSSVNDKVLSNFSYNGNNATVKINELLTSLTEHSDAVHTSANIDCIYCYQNVINNPKDFTNRLNNTNMITLTGALSGRYTIFNDDEGLQISNNVNKQWQFNDQSKFLTDYIIEVKMAIAQILTGNTSAFSSFEQSYYNTLLNKINFLGFNSSFMNAFINYINNNVIGAELYNENIAIYNTFSENQKGELVRWLEPADIDKHYYKGYNIVVPAIVKQALSNTFENTEVSLYPSVSQDSVSVSSVFNNLSINGNTQGFVLMPKANTPMTKLAIEVQGQLGETATLSFKAVIGGTAYPISKSITFTGEKQTVEIDLSSIGNAMGAYSGNTQSYTDNHLFGNNDLPDAHGNNYILLDLSETTCNFTLTFNGLYSK